jgi:hypothetical protein
MRDEVESGTPAWLALMAQLNDEGNADMARDKKVVNLHPTKADLLDACKEFGEDGTIVVLNLSETGRMSSASNSSSKAEVLFLLENYKLHVLAGSYDD